MVKDGHCGNSFTWKCYSFWEMGNTISCDLAGPKLDVWKEWKLIRVFFTLFFSEDQMSLNFHKFNSSCIMLGHKVQLLVSDNYHCCLRALNKCCKRIDLLSVQVTEPNSDKLESDTKHRFCFFVIPLVSNILLVVSRQRFGVLLTYHFTKHWLVLSVLYLCLSAQNKISTFVKNITHELHASFFAGSGIPLK